MERHEQDDGHGAGKGTDRGVSADDQTRLLALFGRLPPTQRRALVEHAERLAATCAAPVASGAAAPGAMDRPAQESVVQAIRRLARAHPELERGKLMAATARRLAEHMIDGREAAEVIDELEALFAREQGRSVGRSSGYPERTRQVRTQRDDP